MTPTKTTFYELGKVFPIHEGKPLYSWPLLGHWANDEIVETQEIFDAYHAVYGENPPREERNLY